MTLKGAALADTVWRKGWREDELEVGRWDGLLIHDDEWPHIHDDGSNDSHMMDTHVVRSRCSDFANVS